MCIKKFDGSEKELAAFGIGTNYEWFTPFFVLHGIDNVDALLNVRTLAGTWQGKPCFQTAAVRPETPDAPSLFTVGAFTSSAGFTFWRQPVATTDKLLVRVGVAYNNASGTLLGRASVAPKFTLNECARVLGSGMVNIQQGQVVGTDVVYFPIGDFGPTVNFDKVMAAISVEDNESTHLEYQLVCRTANDLRAPNLWQNTEAAWNAPAAGNSERNTGSLAIPAGANAGLNMHVQWGIAARKKAGATGNPRAQLRVMVVGSFV